MPGESWRDWKEQSFSQSGCDGATGVTGGVFIPPFHSQSHAEMVPRADFVSAYLRSRRHMYKVLSPKAIRAKSRLGFSLQNPRSPLPRGCPSVGSAEKESSGRKPPHEQLVPTESTKRDKRGQ